MTTETGWKEDGTPDESPTIESCLRRAAWSLQVAYRGKARQDGVEIQLERKNRLIQFGLAYSNLAIALQNERDYEQREITRIAEIAKGGGHAALRPDESDGVLD